MPTRTDKAIIKSLVVFKKKWRAKVIVYLYLAAIFGVTVFYAMVILFHNLTSV